METRTIYVTDQQGNQHIAEGMDGWRLMEVIRDHGLNIYAECGGSCACATCHVYVGDDWLGKLPPPTDEETDRLDDAMMVEDNSRLSCQILMDASLDGLSVTLAPGTEKP
jgi:2Fe-2S ferredoxin